ncbi:hypothetical protein [Streptomyces clavifer]|uniref:hypothetical protein n=1 Tax=Streptomyces clavifer TaxID=68188 RepID=UPI0038250798
MIGGPLDGQLIDVTGWSRQLVDGTALITGCRFGPGGRTHDEGRPGDLDRLHSIGDTP